MYVNTSDVPSTLHAFGALLLLFHNSEYVPGNLTISRGRRSLVLRRGLSGSSFGSREAYFFRKCMCYSDFDMLVAVSNDSRNISFSA